jgi:hypothetical protein
MNSACEGSAIILSFRVLSKEIDDMKKIGLLATIILALVIVGVVWAETSPAVGTSQTNFLVQNMATGAGENAAILVDYYNETGNNVYTNSSIVLAPKATWEFKIKDEPLPAGFVGSAIVSSDRPVAAVVNLKMTNVPGAPDGITQAAYNGAAVGVDKLYFPSFWASKNIGSRITVQNTENSAVDIEMAIFDRDGNAYGVKQATLQAYGSRTFCACDPDDLPPGFPDAFGDGSVVVSAPAGRGIAGASTAQWPNRTAAYQALTDANKGTILYVPSHFRVKFGNQSEFTLFSAINIQNTSTTTAAPVKIEYFNRQTGALDLELTKTIPPNSAIGANTKGGGSFDAADFLVLNNTPGTSDQRWDGSVVVTSLDGIDLVGTGVTNWGTAGHVGMSALVTEADASEVVYLPAQFRLDFGAGKGISQWSSLNLQNVGGTTISKNDLSIEYIDTEGNSVKTFTGASLPFDLEAGAALGLNTKGGGDVDKSDFDSFPTQDGFPRYKGGIYITGPAGSKLIATSNIIYLDRAAVYNAVPGS